MKSIKTAALTTIAVLAPGLASAAFPDVVTSGAKNVVLVTGAHVDGSSWRSMHDQLWIKGYKITVVQQAHTSLDDDVAAARAAIDSQDGPVVLVGHDSAGAVITIAGASDKVKALVYVAAVQPDIGESAAQLAASKPLPDSAILTSRDGHQSIDPAKFRDVFAADLPPNRTNFMAASQAPVARAALDAPVWAAAWRSKPSYAVVATDDRFLNPELQRWMYKRAGAKVTEIKASHALQLSRPEAVAEVVVQAALSVK
jgi:pimeloyl-ACP methyl ester carboxylesterase